MNQRPRSPAVPSRSGRPKGACRARRHLWFVAVAISTVGLLGCDLAGPSEYRVIGIMRLDHPRVGEYFLPEIPETVTAGVPFEITVTTGGNSCYRAGETEVAVDGRSAVVTPYDYVRADAWETGCFAILQLFEHKATMVFKEPGIASIVLRYSTGREGGYRPEDHKSNGRRVYALEVTEAG